MQVEWSSLVQSCRTCNTSIESGTESACSATVVGDGASLAAMDSTRATRQKPDMACDILHEAILVLVFDTLILQN